MRHFLVRSNLPKSSLQGNDDRPVGFAIFFHNFSTFLGKPGPYLEDLFVRPEFWGQGIGKLLLICLAKLAVEHGCDHFEWSVLDWNESAVEFYKRLGTVPLEELTVFRPTGEALEALANGQGYFYSSERFVNSQRMARTAAGGRHHEIKWKALLRFTIREGMVYI